MPRWWLLIWSRYSSGHLLFMKSDRQWNHANFLTKAHRSVICINCVQNKCLERKIKKTTGVNEYDFVFPTFPFSEFQKDFNARQVNQLILPVQRPHICVLSVSDEWQLEIVLFEKTVSFMTECVFRLVNHAWRKLYKLHLQVCTLKSLKRRNLKKILQEITWQ